MLDPSALLTASSAAAIRDDPALGPASLKLYVPAAFVTFLKDRQSALEGAPTWNFFGGPEERLDHGPILDLIQGRGVEPFQVGRDASEALGRFDANYALGREFERDRHLQQIMREEVAFLATHSFLAGRTQRTFEALRRGGCVLLTGIERHLPPRMRENLARIGWPRFFTKVGFGFGEIWLTAGLPPPIPQLFQSAAVLIAYVDP